jgi:hypothetical protein
MRSTEGAFKAKEIDVSRCFSTIKGKILFSIVLTSDSRYSSSVQAFSNGCAVLFFSNVTLEGAFETRQSSQILLD